ncbi:MAG: hypothetical protein IID46_11455 [Planctomycetes bacterium]|nr:hypothetical protein [Planctomycetota bacterium]
MLHIRQHSLPGICSAVFAVAVILSAVGCGQEEEVTSYEVPKLHVLDKSNPSKSANSPHKVGSVSRVSSRMLGAILPQQNQTWFFKLTGPDEAVATIEQTFETFIQSIKFAESKPAWTLPEDWRQLPDDAPENNGVFKRFATLMIETSGRVLELSVTSLPSAQGDVEGYLLLNINRWRGQLGLQPTTASRLAQETKKLTLDGATATLVNLLGTSRSSSMGGAPFASGNSSPAPGQKNKRATGPSENPQPRELSYTTPEGWSPGKLSFLRKAAFEVIDLGLEQKIEITVISVGGDLLSNVNRWRGQIQLQEITQAELDRDLKTIEVDGDASPYVDLVGPEKPKPRQSILAVIATNSGRTWFIKLKGDAELAAREKQNFESFVRSIRFSKPDGSR